MIPACDAEKEAKLPVGLPRPRLIVFHCNRSVINGPTNLHTTYASKVTQCDTSQLQDPYARNVFELIRVHSSERSVPVNSAMARTVYGTM